MKQLSFHRLLQASVAVCAMTAAVWCGTGPAMAATPVTPLKIVQNNSILSFNTIKAGTAGVGGMIENMQFKRFEGGLDSQGHISLKIDLTSIQTGIPLRDERMQSILWNVKQYPSVTFSGQIKPETLPSKNEESTVLDVHGELTMAGQSKPITTQLQVTALSDKWLVNTRKPVVIKADDYGLTAGVEALRAIMGLNYISSSVAVSFQLELKPIR